MHCRHVMENHLLMVRQEKQFRWTQTPWLKLSPLVKIPGPLFQSSCAPVQLSSLEESSFTACHPPYPPSQRKCQIQHHFIGVLNNYKAVFWVPSLMFLSVLSKIQIVQNVFSGSWEKRMNEGTHTRNPCSSFRGVD